MPKFELGDLVEDIDGTRKGRVEHIRGYDDLLHGYRYMVRDTGGSRLNWNETNMRLQRGPLTGDRAYMGGKARTARLLKNARGEEPDEQAARELSLYIENEYDLVGAPNSQGKAIEKNLLKKIRNGSFNLELSEKAWMYLMETGAKKYCKEYASPGDWSKVFNKPTRELVAHEFATTFAAEHGSQARNGFLGQDERGEDDENESGIETEEFDAPAHWASAFINGDTSGLEDEDLADFEAWCAKHPDLGWVVDVSEETHVGRWNGLQTELATYTAHVQEQKANGRGQRGPSSAQPFSGNQIVMIEKRDARGKLDFSAPQPPRHSATFDEVYEWYFRAVPEGDSASWSDLKEWLDEQGWVLRAKTW